MAKHLSKSKRNFFNKKCLLVNFLIKKISKRTNNIIGIKEPKKTNCIPVAIAANKAIPNKYLPTLSLRFWFFRYLKIK